MDYEETLAYIHSLSWLGSRPGLSRTEELLNELGSPQSGMKFIHVAGTNGKGSVSAMCASLLRRAGYRVGLYTSPYIVRFNERIVVDGEQIPDGTLSELATLVRPIADNMADHPTEFELITALAFLYFKRRQCDIVVLEVGMGGRLDSTNVIETPLASVITGIALDHTAVLGDTVEKIAFEKAGIIKPGRPVVYGGRDEKAFGVIKTRADELGAPLTRTSIDKIKIKRADLSGTLFDYGELEDISLSLLGDYQPENAATVIETVNVLRKEGICISDAALREGLAEASWPARFELLSASGPIVVFDGSHNIQGVTAAVESIKKLLGGKVVLLMGVLADKDYESMVDLLLPVTGYFVSVTPPSPRALAAGDLANVFESRGAEGLPAEGIKSGVPLALEYARRLRLPLVMLGSLYMYGEVLSAFREVKQ